LLVVAVPQHAAVVTVCVCAVLYVALVLVAFLDIAEARDAMH
jgi:heme/copper-type cytochrome/quinol oxidase subunit 4